jgi:hypothetical protein
MGQNSEKSKTHPKMRLRIRQLAKRSDISIQELEDENHCGDE